ncbi:OmpA family protein [Sphingobacterium bovistauri]|uniref:OmpA family protein n=1 Tax=Sphingobacterium bovistauri TaxID=2781959 RepID=A0ABS7Z594_9SPHI|nr:OmpA family protein [Sphingobacterium bovistauri]MCA5004134.1 OmpA family protein [Sphingobacterium bovistauri]
MKKVILGSILAILFVFHFNYGVSQSIKTKKDTVVNVSNDKYKIVTNRFFENWFIGVGAGAQFVFGDHDKQMKFQDRLTPAFNAYFGKWFTPGVAIRGGYTGYKLKGLTHNRWSSAKTHSTGEIYEDVASADLGLLEIQRFDYNHLHADVLFNISNLIGGYNQSRFYNVSPYFGFGWAWVSASPESSEPSINIGINNSFRINNSFNIIADFRGALMKDDFEGELGGRKEDGIISGTVGIAYNIGKRNWDRESIVEITTYEEAELNALRDRVNKLANDNDALKRQLAESNSKSITDVKIDKNVLVAPILITFPINKSTVSNEARVNLGYFAKVIKEGATNVIYNISGYADKGTGTPASNNRLSRERAEAIFNVLVRDFGVPSSRLTISNYGGVENMYYDDPRLSRAVIVLGN